IPADVRVQLSSPTHTAGMTLVVPVGDALVPVTITARTVAVRLSLRTPDPGEAKARQATIARHLARVWKSLREQPRALSQKEAVALAGEVYRRWTGALEDDAGDAGLWRNVRDMNRPAFDGTYGTAALLIGDNARRTAGLEQRFGAFVDLALSWKAL